MSVTLHSRIPLVAARAASTLPGLVEKAALDVESRAKAAAPVDTGALVNSIDARMVGDREAVVAVGVEYAVYVEFGTSRMSAQPFLRPAADAVRPEFEAAVARAIAAL